MQTSSTIKYNQAHPPAILRAECDGNDDEYAWQVEGRTCRNCMAVDKDACRCGRYHARTYYVRRYARSFVCTCRVHRRPTLCRHVQAVLLRLALAKGACRVAFWTDFTDATRQHRRHARYKAKSRSFWVTYNWPDDVQRVPGARIAQVTEDQWNGVMDVYYEQDGRWWRQTVREVA